MSGATAQPLGPFRGVGIDRGGGLAPQRVGEDPDGSAGGADVLHLAAGNPVVDGAAADADELAGARNRDGLAVQHHHSLSQRVCLQAVRPAGLHEVFRQTLSAGAADTLSTGTAQSAAVLELLGARNGLTLAISSSSKEGQRHAIVALSA